MKRIACSEGMVKSAVAEFIGCWSAGGKASLSLDTQGGATTITFTCTLGHPDAPLHKPSHSHRRKRHRGPAEKQRSRERAALHQMRSKLALPTAPSPTFSPSLPSLPISPTPASVVDEMPVTYRSCKRCGLPCKNHPAPGYGMATCQVSLAVSPSTPSSPKETLRDANDSMVDLLSSPVKDSRNESCYNCGERLSPTHQCYETELTENDTLSQPPSPGPTPTPTPGSTPTPSSASPSPSTAISSASPSKEPANYRGLVDAYILCAEEGYEALGLRGQVLPSEQDRPASQKIKKSLSNVLDACISFTYEAFCKKYPELSHDIIVSKVTPLFLEAKQHVPYDDIIQRLTEFRISSLLSKYNPEPKLDWTSPKRNRKKK